MVGHAVAFTLFIPYVTSVAATRTAAQQVSGPTWAVLDFYDRTGRVSDGLKAVAADAVRNELEKINEKRGIEESKQYELVERETLERAYRDLDLVKPVMQKESLLRLGSEVNATSVVTGDILNWRVVKDGPGKHAEVLLKVEVLDVASGVVVNGTAFIAISTARPADTADDTLLEDALRAGAFQAISTITGKEPPHAAVLNTYEHTALINAGERAGFKPGQQVIVLRGREQVADAVVSDTDPDEATITTKHVYRGVQPGDKVRVVFTPPDISSDFPKTGTDVMTIHHRPQGANSGLLTALAVIGLIVAVVATGEGTGTMASVTAQASPNGPATTGYGAILVSWTPDWISKGADRRMEFDLWRGDIGYAYPVQAVPGSQLSYLDIGEAAVDAFEWTSTPTITSPGGITCANTSQTYTESVVIGQPVIGKPYSYSVSLIYRLMGIELPTATTDAWCYFSTGLTAAKGTATPYTQTTLLSPSNGSSLSGPVTFEFTAQGSALYPSVIAQYVVEISNSITFPTSSTMIISTQQSTAISGTTLTAGPINLAGVYSGSNTIYWRVGVKNIADNPGPVKDSLTGERYIFSTPYSLVR
jgi:hypothetical protein